MLEAKSAPLIASKYFFCSGVQADGPATLDDGIGADEFLLPEQAVNVSGSIEVTAISFFAGKVKFFTRQTYQP